ATSSTIPSGAKRWAAARAAPPSPATVTVKPSAESVRVSMRCSGGSSSTTSTRPASGDASATGDVATDEDQERRSDGGDPVQRTDPCGAHDRLPVGGRAQQPLP